MRRSVCVSLLVVLALGLATSAALARTGARGARSFNEEFAGGKLQPGWSWYHRNPKTSSLTKHPDFLHLEGSHEIAANCTGVENFLLRKSPAGDFEITTAVQIRPKVNYQEAGLIVFNDADNYMKLDVVFNSMDVVFNSNLWGPTTGVELLREQSAVFNPTPWPNSKWKWGKTAYLRISRVENSYSGYYSSNGTGWHPVGELEAGNLSHLRIGLFAMSGCGDTTQFPPVSADFDFFRIT